METDKEIELQILHKIAETGSMIEKDFNKLFANNGFAYNIVFKRIINFSPVLTSGFNQHGTAGHGKYIGGLIP